MPINIRIERYTIFFRVQHNILIYIFFYGHHNDILIYFR